VLPLRVGGGARALLLVPLAKFLEIRATAKGADRRCCRTASALDKLLDENSYGSSQEAEL